MQAIDCNSDVRPSTGAKRTTRPTALRSAPEGSIAKRSNGLSEGRRASVLTLLVVRDLQHRFRQRHGDAAALGERRGVERGHGALGCGEGTLEMEREI